MIPPPLLYTYRRCPYAMRARMALLLGGHAFDAFEIVLRDKPTALMQASPKATVPVLVLDDQTVIDQSWAIMRWALSVPPPQPPASNLQRWWTLGQSEQAQELLQRNDGAFKHHLDRYKYPQRVEGSEDRTPQDIAYEHRQGALDVLLFPLEKVLSAHAFLTGDEPRAADIAIFPFVRQFAAVDPVWFHAVHKKLFKAAHDLSALGGRACAPNSSRLTLSCAGERESKIRRTSPWGVNRLMSGSPHRASTFSAALWSA